MKHLSKSSLYLILISMGVVGCEDQSDVRRISTGHLMVSGGFVFAKTPPGGHETRTVSIHNVSEASVTLTEFEQLSDDSFQASWSLIGSNGKALEKAEDGLPGTIDLAAGHELRVSLTHRPTSVDDLPIWNFDGSSTEQAPGGNSEILLIPLRASLSN